MRYTPEQIKKVDTKFGADHFHVDYLWDGEVDKGHDGLNKNFIVYQFTVILEDGTKEVFGTGCLALLYAKTRIEQINSPIKFISGPDEDDIQRAIEIMEQYIKE